MNLLSKALLARYQFILLFMLIWLHISVLDLFYITYRGPVFMWQENTQWLTLLVHFGIALASTICYWLVKNKGNSSSHPNTNNRPHKNS